MMVRVLSALALTLSPRRGNSKVALPEYLRRRNLPQYGNKFSLSTGERAGVRAVANFA
jgi:hypothetical protein